MNRYAWMVVRAYTPALAALGLAAVAMVWTSVFGSSARLNGMVDILKWIPPLALLAALVAGAIATLRMWNWQSGKAPKCAGCGGLLGRVHHGADGDYRKCLACAGKQPTA